MEMEQRVKDYWTRRSHDYGAVRKNEQENELGQRWRRELEGHLPQGIDLTPAMLQEARAAATQRGLCIPFLEFDFYMVDGSTDIR